MNKMELAGRFAAVADALRVIHGMIEDYGQHLDSDVDQRAARSMVTDLHWAVENCTVISLHLQGKALDDTMGMTSEKHHQPPDANHDAPDDTSALQG